MALTFHRSGEILQKKIFPARATMPVLWCERWCSHTERTMTTMFSKSHCVFQTPIIAGFFGHEPDGVIDEAADYLLGQLASRSRLEWMDKNDQELEISLNCTPMDGRAPGEGFFLEVSTYGASGINIVGGAPEDLLSACSYLERYRIVRDTLVCAIECYPEYAAA